MSDGAGVGWLPGAGVMAALLLTAGCAAPQKPSTMPSDAHAGSTLGAEDAFQIRQIVLRDLFDFQDGRLHPIKPDITAYVIDDPNATKLAARFGGHTPPVVNDAVRRDDEGRDIDAVTSRPVEVYSVRLRETSCQIAHVGAGWHSSVLSGVWYSYELEKSGAGDWVIRRRIVAGVN